MGTIRKDPFYYGMYMVSDYQSDQRIYNPYFKPVITFYEYEELQKLIGKKNKRPRKQAKEDIQNITIIPNGLLISDDGYVVNVSLPSKNQRFIPKLKELQKLHPEATLQDVVKLSQVRYKLSNPKSHMNNAEIT